MIYYPEYDVSVNNDNHSTTESYFSATSSTYNTPKSNTANGINTHAHAHGLLATWNARKLSKQSNRSKQSNEYSQPRLKSRENSKANKSSSRSKNKRENYTPSDKIKTVIKNVPHIYTGANTPALSANNDAILSGKAFETLPPISVPNKKQRDEYNKKHNILKNKRRKSKELKIKSNLPQMKQNGNNNNNNGTPNGLRNRSTSLIFTPSQLESAAKYSFRTIQEEPSPNNNSNSDTSSIHNSLYMKAVSLHQNKHFEECERVIKDILKTNPNHPQALLLYKDLVEQRLSHYKSHDNINTNYNMVKQKKKKEKQYIILYWKQYMDC
eukprot:457668_1